MRIGAALEQPRWNVDFNRFRDAQWKIDQSLDGTAEVGIKPFSTTLYSRYQGTLHSQHHIADTSLHGAAIQYQDAVECEIGLVAGTLIEHRSALADNWLGALLAHPQMLRHFSCDVPQATGSMDGETVLTISPIILSLTQDRDAQDVGSLKLHYAMNSLVATQAYGESMQRLAELLREIGDVSLAKFIPVNIAELGEQFAYIDATYTGPLGSLDLTDDDKLSLEITRFELGSNQLTVKLDGTMVSDMMDTMRNVSLKSRTSLTASARYDAIMQQEIAAAVGASQSYPNIRPPELSKLSPLTLRTNGQFAFQPQAKGLNATLSVTELALESSQWKLAANAAVQTGSLLPIPQGAIGVTCSDCPNLIADLERLHTVDMMMAKYQSKPRPPGFTTPEQQPDNLLYSNFLDFLPELAAQNSASNASTYRYEITNRGFNPEVNGIGWQNLSQQLQTPAEITNEVAE